MSERVSTKHQILSGVFYTALARYSGVIISLIISAILARLISPEAFGVVTTASIIIGFFSMFTDMGIGTAIVQKKDLDTDDLHRIFSFTIWSGAVLAILFFAASWPIASFYNQPVLRILCQLLAVNLFFASANIVPNALFFKNKEFKFIALRTLFIQVVVGAFSITAALMGASVYALIISPIASAVFSFIISYRRYPQHCQLTWGLTAIKKIFSYSAYQFLFNFVNYFGINSDKLLMGKYLSMQDLGYYNKSYTLMTLPLQNITYVIAPVMHPVLSDMQNDRLQLAIVYERIARLMAYIGIPLAVLLYFIAEELTLIIFGPNWMPSIPVFRILALSVPVQIVLSGSGAIYQAANDTRSLFVCGIFSAITNVTGILIGIFYLGTLTGLAWCITVTYTLNFFQCYGQMYHITFKRSILHFFNQLWRPLLLSALIVLCLYPLYQVMSGMNMFLTIIVKSIVAFVIWVGFIHITHEYNIPAEIRKLLKH
jgi:PST family polysaccharide transporter